MKELKDIIKDVRRKNGVVRRKYDLKSLRNGMTYFAEIANAMLIDSDEGFDFKSSLIGVESLVSWAYLKGENLNFRKGILFKGHTGRGKTFLFKVFNEFLKLDGIRCYQNGETTLISLKIVNAKQIDGEYQDPVNGGYKVIERYSKMSCLAIDDIGAEQDESSNYANKINIISEIIDKREEANMLTFGTTNLNKMDEKYDDRAISRMSRLFNVISINHGRDFRKPKSTN